MCGALQLKPTEQYFHLTRLYMFQLFLKVKLKCFDHFQRLIIYTKKLLNSDWLRKECSSPVTLVQITNGF